MPIQSISLSASGATLAVFWLALGAALLLAIWAYRAPEPPLPRRIRTVLAALRFIALAVLVFALFQPVVTVAGGGSGKPLLPVFLDLSASMNLPVAAASGDTARRLDHVASALSESWPELQRQFDVELFGFGSDLREIDSGGEAPPARVADAGATRLGPALSEALGRRLSRPAAAAVVLSDGGVNAGTDPIHAAERLGVAVIAVPASLDSVVQDVWIAECLSNRSVFLGQETTIAVRLGSFLNNNARIRVVLKDGDRVVTGQHVALPAGDGDVEVELAFTPERLGAQRFTVHVEPLAGEITATNNNRLVAFDVVEERQQVLILADEVAWDLTFTRRAIERDRTLETTLLGRLGRRDGRYRPVGSGKLRELPTQAAEFLPFAAVVLVGVQSDRLPQATAQALASYLREGGGLVVVGGQHGRTLQSLTTGALQGLLPVRFIGASTPGLVTPELSAAGLSHPVTALGESPARAGALWANLPPVYASATIEASLGGDVLVEGAGGPGSEVALVVAGPAGRGRAVVIAASEIWRWDFLMRSGRREGDLFRRLMGEAVRWVAEGRQHSDFVLFADKGVFLSGEPVSIGARLTDEHLQPIDDAAVEVTVAPADSAAGPMGETALVPGETRGHYTGTVGYLPPGSYRVRATATRGERRWSSEGVHFVVDEANLEGGTPGANPALLRRLAERTGGAVLAPEEVGVRLADLVEARRQIAQATEIKLWNHPLLFLLFIGALTFEWLLRRRRGLA